MFALQGTVKRSNADGDRCINSVLVNVPTKGQGGAIFPMEGRKFGGAGEKWKMEPTGSESCGLAKGVAI